MPHLPQNLNAQKFRSVLPRLSADEFAALEANIIASNGIFDPIILDADLAILDGQARYEIIQKHRIKNATCEIIKGLTVKEKIEFILSKNCARRNMTTEQKRDLIIRELKRDPGRTDRLLARIIGVSDKTVAKYRRQQEACAEIPHMAQRTGEREGKTYKITRVGGRIASAGVMARDLEKNTSATPGFPHTKHELGRSTALEIREQHAKPVDFVPPGQIYTCDFRDLEKEAKIKPGSVRLVLTDAMYDKKSLFVWPILAELAERWLVPGGALVTYCGIVFLQEVMDGLRKHLTYHTQCVSLWEKSAAKGRRVNGMPSATNITKRVEQNYTPIHVYSKQSCRPLTILKSVLRPPENDNPTSYYPFQKYVEHAIHFIEALTRPGDLVVDPFMGSGTVGIACEVTGLSASAQSRPLRGALKLGHPEEKGSACILPQTQRRENKHGEPAQHGHDRRDPDAPAA